MDLTTVFCDIDDFCREFALESPQELLPMPSPRRNRRAGLGLSEIMTILVMFHHSGGHRNFKGYYTQHVCCHCPGEFPGAPSCSRLIQLVPRVLWPLLHYLGTRRGEVSGVSFVDSTPLRVCHNARIHSHKVFQGIARRSPRGMVLRTQAAPDHQRPWRPAGDPGHPGQRRRPQHRPRDGARTLRKALRVSESPRGRTHHQAPQEHEAQAACPHRQDPPEKEGLD